MQFPALPNPVDDPGLQANLEYIARYLIPTGLGPLPWPSDTVPPFGAPTWRESGWVLLDGTKYKQLEYNELFRILGTKFNIGGEAADEFRVPDMRGRVPVGMDNIGGSDAGRLAVANTLGLTGGEELHALTKAEVPRHTHGPGSYVINTWWPTNIISNAYQQYAAFAGLYATDRFGIIDGTVSGTSEDGTITGLGSGSPTHNNMPPYLLTYYIMKA